MLECYPVLQISCRWSIFRLTRSAIFFGMFPRILFCPMCNLFYRVNRLVTEFGNMSPKLLWAKSNYCRLLQLARELMKFMLSTRQLITVNVEPHWVLHLSLTCAGTFPVKLLPGRSSIWRFEALTNESGNIPVNQFIPQLIFSAFGKATPILLLRLPEK